MAVYTRPNSMGSCHDAPKYPEELNNKNGKIYNKNVLKKIKLKKNSLFFSPRYFLICVNYFFYGETVADYFGALVQREEPLQFLARYHRFISFALYLAGGSRPRHCNCCISQNTLALWPLCFHSRFPQRWIRFHLETVCVHSRVLLRVTLLCRKWSKKRKNSGRLAV